MWQVLATSIIIATAAAVAPPAQQQHKPPNWRCFVRDAMVFYDRVHVRCYNKTADGVTFFAVDTSQPIAVSLITKALSAMQQGRPVRIAYAPDGDLNPPGCRKTDCRRLLDITF
jgi:hypothetical protein